MSANDDLRDELLAIRKQYGVLTAEHVLAAATPVGSPLHDKFTWDDSEAAEQYRLIEARKLIRFVREPYTRPTGEPGTVRFFHPQPQASGAMVYQPLAEIVQDPIASALLMKQAEREWRALWARYQHLQEFVDLVRGAVTVAQPPAAP